MTHKHQQSFKHRVLAVYLWQKMRKVLQDDSKGSAAHSKVVISLLCFLLQVYRHLQEDRQVVTNGSYFEQHLSKS